MPLYEGILWFGSNGEENLMNSNIIVCLKQFQALILNISNFGHLCIWFTRNKQVRNISTSCSHVFISTSTACV
uniref:Uncharacterized protein n=1 Tax=Rhizophora mucronata TaxID=61149 RepID=A0A2P2MX54_RHIMU